MRNADLRVRGTSKSIGWISASYLAVGAVGTWVAVRHGLVARPFGWDLGGVPLPGFVLGTALSAPLPMSLALVVANLLLWRGGPTERRAARMIGLFGIGFTIGMLAEPIT